MENTNTKKQPWHLWLIALFFLCLYGYGIYDFFMIFVYNEANDPANGLAEQALIYDLSNEPLWIFVLKVIHLISGFFASVLLLLRLKWAVYFSWAAFFFIIIQRGEPFGFMHRMESYNLLVYAVIMLMVFGLALYSDKMKAKNVLR